jgi:hypothetical protein
MHTYLGEHLYNLMLLFDIIRWTVDAGTNPYGEPALHLAVARRLATHGVRQA